MKNKEIIEDFNDLEQNYTNSTLEAEWQGEQCNNDIESNRKDTK